MVKAHHLIGQKLNRWSPDAHSYSPVCATTKEEQDINPALMCAYEHSLTMHTSVFFVLKPVMSYSVQYPIRRLPG